MGALEIPDKLFTSYKPRHPRTHANSAHTYQFPSSPWARALDRYMVAELRSRVGWTSARNEERKTKGREGGEEGSKVTSP